MITAVYKVEIKKKAASSVHARNVYSVQGLECNGKETDIRLEEDMNMLCILNDSYSIR